MDTPNHEVCKGRNLEMVLAHRPYLLYSSFPFLAWQFVVQ